MAIVQEEENEDEIENEAEDKMAAESKMASDPKVDARSVKSMMSTASSDYGFFNVYKKIYNKVIN